MTDTPECGHCVGALADGEARYHVAWSACVVSLAGEVAKLKTTRRTEINETPPAVAEAPRLAEGWRSVAEADGFYLCDTPAHHDACVEVGRDGVYNFAIGWFCRPCAIARGVFAPPQPVAQAPVATEGGPRAVDLDDLEAQIKSGRSAWIAVSRDFARAMVEVCREALRETPPTSAPGEGAVCPSLCGLDVGSGRWSEAKVFWQGAIRFGTAACREEGRCLNPSKSSNSSPAAPAPATAVNPAGCGRVMQVTQKDRDFETTCGEVVLCGQCAPSAPTSAPAIPKSPDAALDAVRGGPCAHLTCSAWVSPGDKRCGYGHVQQDEVARKAKTQPGVPGQAPAVLKGGVDGEVTTNMMRSLVGVAMVERVWTRSQVGMADRFLVEVEQLRAEVARLKGENACDACASTGAPVSGLPCMCRGTGKMSVAALMLREELAQLRAAGSAGGSWRSEAVKRWRSMERDGRDSVEHRIRDLKKAEPWMVMAADIAIAVLEEAAAVPSESKEG